MLISARSLVYVLSAAGLLLTESAAAEVDDRKLELEDIFELEYAADPQISPSGGDVVYVRNSMDIMADRRRASLWIVNGDGSEHRPITTGARNDASPRWSPDGDRIVYISRANGAAELYVRWLASGQTARLTQLARRPEGIAWSPDGRHIAFSMFVPSKSESLVRMPAKPEGARWARPPKVIDDLTYRFDGHGYLDQGYYQLFVLPAEGGTPRQLTSGDFHHRGEPAWTPDGKALVFAANRHENWQFDPLNSEIYSVSIEDRSITQLTDRQGPDAFPRVSPDGRMIAYVGFDDAEQGYQVTRLYVMGSDGSESRPITTGLDRSVRSPVWSADGRRIYFLYDDRGDTKLAYADLRGETKIVADAVGGTSLGRPYPGGSFSLARNGSIAFTQSLPYRPADLAVIERRGGEGRRLTALNDDLLAHKELGQVEEIWFESSHDGREIQGWVVRPPGFEAERKYPLILEIHGGPFANYGARFAAEIQLYAAAGYVVLYTNPRGSTSYGEEFGNLIHHNYPGEDYDDLMSGVDAAIDLGFVDAEQLYITGGSGGGVLTSWTIGKTDRFRAAVVAKPVINWYSFVLTADLSNFFYKYWFPGLPWEHPEHYMKRSPISLVGNVVTPTMVLTGEADYRTPMSESEQYYQALKLNGVETVLVRIPGAPHNIARRPSNLVAKVAYVLGWFGRHE